MTIRQALEQAEHQRLDPRAAFSDRSRGRPVPEPEREDDVRTCYQRDTDRIVHSKAFRRLMHKTQVFLCPEGDHYRTRMTHTLESVSYTHLDVYKRQQLPILAALHAEGPTLSQLFYTK